MHPPRVKETFRPWPLQRIAWRALVLATLWWVLAGGAAGAWVPGLLAVALALGVSLRLQPPGVLRFSLVGLLAFMIFFLARSVRGGVQVARMAFQPQLQLRPAVVEIRLRLAPESARVFLASTLNLLPGTLSAGLDGDCLLLHVLDECLPVQDGVHAAEVCVARLLCLELLP